MSQILIVEDDPDTREILCELLSEEGYDVRSAAHGCEALAVLATQTPALVVLDLYMPVMNGWDLLAAMHGDDRLRTIPTLVLTSAPSQAPPGTAVIAKPQEIGVFLKAVRAAIAR